MLKYNEYLSELHMNDDAFTTSASTLFSVIACIPARAECFASKSKNQLPVSRKKG